MAGHTGYTGICSVGRFHGEICLADCKAILEIVTALPLRHSNIRGMFGTAPITRSRRWPYIRQACIFEPEVGRPAVYASKRTVVVVSRSSLVREMYQDRSSSVQLYTTLLLALCVHQRFRLGNCRLAELLLSCICEGRSRGVHPPKTQNSSSPTDPMCPPG
jgi:hypothetical protein